MSKAIARCGTMCPVKTVDNPGIVISHTCVDLTYHPSGMLMVRGVLVTFLLTTSTPSIMKMDKSQAKKTAPPKTGMAAQNSCARKAPEKYVLSMNGNKCAIALTQVTLL
jgi:hypothetical protein